MSKTIVDKLSPHNSHGFLINEKTIDLICHGISGAVAGSVAKMFLYPLGFIETRLQALQKHHNQKKSIDENLNKISDYKYEQDETSDSKKNDDDEKQEYHGINKVDISIREFVRLTIEDEGYMGFYRGLLPYVISTLVSSGTYFFWYEYFKSIFIKGGFDIKGYSKTAFFAGLISIIIANPINVVHTRILLSSNESSTSILKTVKKIFKREGIQGFFKGLGAGIILLINPIIQFIIYEYLKLKFQHTKYKAALFFIAGAVSKAVAASLSYPYQTIKTNLQAEKDSKLSQLSLIKDIYIKRGGLKGFYNGLTPKLFQTVLNNALLLMIYEKLFLTISLIVKHIFKK